MRGIGFVAQFEAGVSAIHDKLGMDPHLAFGWMNGQLGVLFERSSHKFLARH